MIHVTRTASLVLLLAGSAAVAGFEPPVSPATPAPASVPAPAAAAKAKPAIYDEQADAQTQINAALAAARKENRRVLIQWGGNWCSWCVRLHETYTSDKPIAKELRYEYVPVFIDSGKPDAKNVEFAKKYGADLAAHGYPYLTILDADGKPLANQETGSLEVQGPDGKSAGVKAGHDPAKVLAFLKKHEAAPLDATAVYNAALLQAKADGKLVFLHFGAPWCGWCRKLEAWMDRPDIAPVLSKAFVDLKIDCDRMTGGMAMLNAQRGSESGGIPWFAILDPNGQILATSEGRAGNIGFPSEPQEIAHFGTMLAKSDAISADQRAALLASLAKN